MMVAPILAAGQSCASAPSGGGPSLAPRPPALLGDQQALFGPPRHEVCPAGAQSGAFFGPFGTRVMPLILLSHKTGAA